MSDLKLFLKKFARKNNVLYFIFKRTIDFGASRAILKVREKTTCLECTHNRQTLQNLSLYEAVHWSVRPIVGPDLRRQISSKNRVFCKVAETAFRIS